MIRSLCLNPTIDRNYYIPGFAPGGEYKMLTPVLGVGGKGVNVARACNQLGVPAACYGIAGRDNARAVLSGVDAVCAERYFALVPGESRTSVNIMDATGGRETYLSEPGPRVTDAQAARLLARLRRDVLPGDIVVCSGSCAPGVPRDFYARVSALCAGRGARCVLDASGGRLRASLSGRYYMIKPNHSELAELCGEAPTQDALALARMARSLAGVSEWVLVSMGGAGGLLLGQGRAYIARVPDVRAVSTVGCGDCCVAGFSVATARGEDAPAAFRYALACGTANALTQGVGCLDMTRFEEVYRAIRPEEIA